MRGAYTKGKRVDIDQFLAVVREQLDEVSAKLGEEEEEWERSDGDEDALMSGFHFRPIAIEEAEERLNQLHLSPGKEVAHQP